MNILGLVVVLMFIHCCAAASNRSSVWLLANTQIYTYNSGSSPTNCFISATGNTQSSSITLLSTSYMTISGTFIQLAQADSASVSYVQSASILSTVTINFIYNSSYYLQLALPLNTGASTSLSISNIFSSYLTPYVSSTAAASLYPIVYGVNTILSPTGTTWLNFQNIPIVISATAPFATGVLITDYVSSSTIAITQWTDSGVVGAAAANGKYNAFYQLGVRTLSSRISFSTPSTLTTGANCGTGVTGGGGTPAASCTSATSIDPSMTSTILTTACATVTAVAAGAVSSTNTVSKLEDAFNKGVYAMNALYETDYAVFGAAGSKFTIATNFGILIALSSILFSFLN